MAITDLAAGIRRNVVQSVQRRTGLPVVEININVHDVNLPSESSGSDDEDEQPDHAR